MKKSITAILLLISLCVSMKLSVYAGESEIYFTDDTGAKCCWVKAKTASVKPSMDPEEGYSWIVQTYQEGDKKGDYIIDYDCDLKAEEGHDCEKDHTPKDKNKMRMYLWKQISDAILTVSCRDEGGYSMTGTKFVMKKVEFRTNQDGSYQINKDGELQYDVVNIYEGTVNTGGIAKLEMLPDREQFLDPDAEFQQLLLVQMLADSEEYAQLKHRWYVNLVKDGRGGYKIYSVTEAPAAYVAKEENGQWKWSDPNWGIKAEPNEEREKALGYDSVNNKLTVVNPYVKGTIDIKFVVEGFEDGIPSWVSHYVTMTEPYYPYNARYGQNTFLQDKRVGTYTFDCYRTSVAAGYTLENVEIAGIYTLTGDPVEVNGNKATVEINKEHANAQITVTYTYKYRHSHNYVKDETQAPVEPTCTEDGYTVYICTNPDPDNTCPGVFRRDKVPAFGHDYKQIIVESSCTQGGYEKYVCTICGEEDLTRHTDYSVKDHEYKDIVTAPTCTEEGFTTQVCIREGCGFTRIPEDSFVPELGHQYDLTKKVAPTCTEAGKEYYKCSRCSIEKVEETGEPTGHDMVFSEIVPPTCTVNGYALYLCNKCDAEIKVEAEGEPASGHKTKGEVTAPTCEEKGYTTYRCTVEGCEHTYQGDWTDPTGHEYVSKVIEPTTEREGYTQHTCKICGDAYTDNPTAKLAAKDETNKKPNDDFNDSNDDSDNGSNNSGSTPPANNSNTKPATNTASASGSTMDTLIVKTVDELEQPLNGTIVALYSGNNKIRQWNCAYDNVSVLDNLEKHANENEIATYTLKQTKAPGGYEVSKDKFTVTISKQGDETLVDVKKSVGSSGDIEVGRDGKQIVTFHNTRKTAQMEVLCRVAVDFGEDCWADEALVKECQDKQYEFVLNWKTVTGEEQTESVLLSHGEYGMLEAKIPFGTEYALTLVDPDGTVTAEFSENASGTLSSDSLDGKLSVEASLKYVVTKDEAQSVDLFVVDAQSRQPLEGATFELKDADGQKLGDLTSSKEGKLNVTDAFNTPGDYLLTQTQAPKGYEGLKGAAPVIVTTAYTPDAESATPALVQTMSTQIAHQAVAKEADGSFAIENVQATAQASGNAQSGGRSLGLGSILGISGAVAAVAGGVATVVLVRKERKLEKLEQMSDETEV